MATSGGGGGGGTCGNGGGCSRGGGGSSLITQQLPPQRRLQITGSITQYDDHSSPESKISSSPAAPSGSEIRQQPTCERQQPMQQVLPAPPPLHQPPQQQRPPPPEQQQQQQQRPSGNEGVAAAGKAASSGGSGDPPMHDTAYGGCAIKVSAHAAMPPTAGKIAHLVRAGATPMVLAGGCTCLLGAVQALALARDMLSGNGISIAFQPFFRSADHSARLLALRVVQPPAGLAARLQERLAVAHAAVAASGSGEPIQLQRHCRQQQPQRTPPAAPGGTAAERAPPSKEGGSHCVSPTQMGEVVYVGAASRHAACGGAAAALLQRSPQHAVVLSAVGAPAVGNALMAAAHAAYYLAGDGLAMLAMPASVPLPASASGGGKHGGGKGGGGGRDSGAATHIHLALIIG